VKAVQIIGLAIVGILLISNSLNALAIGLMLVTGEVSNPPRMVGRVLFVALFEVALIGGFSKLLRRIRAS
jgi:hypothetical protein